MQRAGLSQGGGIKQGKARAASLRPPQASVPFSGKSRWVKGSSLGDGCLFWLQGKALLTNPVLGHCSKSFWGSMQRCGLTAGPSLSAGPAPAQPTSTKQSRAGSEAASASCPQFPTPSGKPGVLKIARGER